MSKIQVDMFEVQLGAALLLQFQLDSGQVVRILADAGVDKSSGYPIDHVFNKLFDPSGTPTGVWSNFCDNKPKLDLIVGTHYDADHLRGLIPIINKLDLDIDEIWLPPVQDDEGVVSTGSVAGGNSSLVKRLMAPDGDQVLRRYLRKRLARIDEVDRVYSVGLESAGESPGGELMQRLVEQQPSFRQRTLALRRTELSDTEEALRYFEQQRSAAARALGQMEDEHAREECEEHDRRFVRAADRLKYRRGWIDKHFQILGRAEHDIVAMRSLGRRWSNEAALASDRFALETIRKSAADEAINAKNLADVVNAIKDRHRDGASRIRIVSEAIPQGAPRYFRWTGAKFQEANPDSRGELGFHLMGPSHELIAELHEKLPIGSYLLAYRAEGLMSGTVTPSNRLSYVMRFHLQEQAILVTGDAGFTDFAPARSKDYYPGLLALLKPLHVVQVAHHGGMNHRFYEALKAGGLPGQTDWSFLMLSHATDDKTRPRAEFSRFVALFRYDERNDVSVLFTSQPTPDKVDTILDLIHPVVPSHTTPADRGDVRLSFPNDEDLERGRTRWRVQQHCVQV